MHSVKVSQHYVSEHQMYEFGTVEESFPTLCIRASNVRVWNRGRKLLDLHTENPGTRQDDPR